MSISPALIIEMIQVYAFPNAERNEERIKELLKNDLVSLDHQGRIRATEKGRVWIEMLCRTPLPEQRWIDPRTEDDK